MEKAACIGSQDIFFPVYNEDGEDYFVDEEGAKALCNACPIMERCKDYAVYGRETEGIWGGTLPEDRRKIRLKNQRTLATLLREIDPAITSIAEDYIFAENVLNAKSQMQTMPRVRK